MNDIAQINDTATGQVSGSAAEVYEEFFLPAYFQQWPARVLDAAHVRAGQRVVDVACGTGVLARAAAERVGAQGSVVGIDINPAMLEVARRINPRIEWRQEPAEALTLASASFDAVVSQFGLMFFADRCAALKEMLRVLRPGGDLAVAVCDRLENSPGYTAVTELVEKLFGARAGDAMRAPFVLGDEQTLRAEFAAAGITDITVTTHAGTARYPSIEAWAYTDIKGWTLADMIDDAQFESFLGEAQRVLSEFADASGRVAFPAPALIVTASKRR